VQNHGGLKGKNLGNFANSGRQTVKLKLIQNHGGLKGKNLGNFANSGRQTVKLKLIQSKIKTVLRSN